MKGSLSTSEGSSLKQEKLSPASLVLAVTSSLLGSDSVFSTVMSLFSMILSPSSPK